MAAGGELPVAAYGDDDAHDLRRNQPVDNCGRLPVDVRVVRNPIGSFGRAATCVQPPMRERAMGTRMPSAEIAL